MALTVEKLRRMDVVILRIWQSGDKRGLSFVSGEAMAPHSGALALENPMDRRNLVGCRPCSR